MIIARQKRKENIVEYLIYMWQIEEMLRACRLDMDEIEAVILPKYDQPENIRQEIRQWYQELADMMRGEGVAEKGHIQLNKNVVSELNALHVQLLKSPHEAVYGSLYYQTLPAIVHLRSKSGKSGNSGGTDVSEIETCLTALYGYLLLKIQGKEISDETSESIKQISRLLSFLAARFHEEETPNGSQASFQHYQ